MFSWSDLSESTGLSTSGESVRVVELLSKQSERCLLLLWRNQVWTKPNTGGQHRLVRGRGSDGFNFDPILRNKFIIIIQQRLHLWPPHPQDVVEAPFLSCSHHLFSFNLSALLSSPTFLPLHFVTLSIQLRATSASNCKVLYFYFTHTQICAKGKPYLCFFYPI